MKSVQVLLYSAPWCRDCREAKRVLDSHRIPYTEIDVETNPGAIEEVLAHVGKRAIPSLSSMANGSSPTTPAAASCTRK
jgi:glutaredoxin